MRVPGDAELRDRTTAELGISPIITFSEEGIAEGVCPVSHGIHEYTRIMRKIPLLASLEDGGFDAAIGGGHRDEQRSRAKERIFSLREAGQRWDPRKQRPEFWRTANTMLVYGQTMRVFPLSNWTAIDIWRYIRRERIEVVSLYFAAPRPTVDRQGALIVPDDDRMPIEPHEQVVTRVVRFRTLGCYPVTGAIESNASTIDDLIDEMEAKKRAGYF